MTNRTLGAAIAIGAALVAVAGLTVAHLGVPISGAIVAIGIVIGAGVARGRFSRGQNTGK